MENYEKERMSLSHALQVLHNVRDSLKVLEMSECVEAFDVTFEWINNAVILFNKLGSKQEK